MAVLKIYGDIGNPDRMMEMFGITDDSVSAKIVSDFLDEHKDDTELTVRINSRGGDVQEGWAIYDLLVNSGKKIKTIGEGKVYSIATIIFLAGSDREMMKNADGLIHNPFIPPYTLADKYESNDLIKIAESLKQEEEKILDFYAEKTGTDKAKLAEYMKEDTKLSAEDMVTLGFATKVIEPILAFAYVTPKNKFNMDEKAFFERLGATLDSAVTKIAGFSRLPAKDQTMTDKDGKEFTIEKETGSPSVGDKASPDGTFIMTDGTTVVISNGEVTEVTAPAEDKSELEIANERIATLEAEKLALESKVTDAEKEKTEASVAKTAALAKEAEAKALFDELSALKNDWKPGTRQQNFKKTENSGAVDVEAVKEKMKNKKP